MHLDGAAENVPAASRPEATGDPIDGHRTLVMVVMEERKKEMVAGEVIVVEGGVVVVVGGVVNGRGEGERKRRKRISGDGCAGGAVVMAVRGRR